jgi:hypothetical protein
MVGHFQDAKKLMEKGVHSDSYARHFTVIWPRGGVAPSPGMQWDLIKCNILYGKATQSQWSKPLASPHVLCVTEKGWKLLNSPDPSLVNSSILAPKSTEHANKNQGSIGINNHKQKESPSADKCKKHENVILEAPNPLLRRRINSIHTDGNESVGFHSHHGTEPCRFISI